MVCQNYCPPEGYVPNMSNPLLDHSYGKLEPFYIHGLSRISDLYRSQDRSQDRCGFCLVLNNAFVSVA